jgi:dipeptide/tripeptide permease
VNEASKDTKRSKFPPLYWLVVVFEFFERGSYYGVMSILSVYMVDELNFSKPDVGLIKGTIQPLLYFLPILSGALADRFGFKRLLMIAFGLLGGGYFLTSQATDYSAVFICLVVMGLGAGTFKPIISGTIARCTDGSNSTLGFGIFYWSINLGAFLVPLFLVPVLRQKVGTASVMIAAAIGTGILLLPTIFLFREPPKPKEEGDKKKDKTSLLQTMADAFEIIYSPIVLLAVWMRRSGSGVVFVVVMLAGFLGYGGWQFAAPAGVTDVFAARVFQVGSGKLVVRGEPNLCRPTPYKLVVDEESKSAVLSLFDPERLSEYSTDVESSLAEVGFLGPVSGESLARYRDEAVEKTILELSFGQTPEAGFKIETRAGGRVALILASADEYRNKREAVLSAIAATKKLAALEPEAVDALVEKANKHPFLLLYVGLMLLLGFIIQRVAPSAAGRDGRGNLALTLGLMAGLYLMIWLLPGLSMFARILTSVLSLTLLSLYAIDYKEMDRFKDHFRFVFMIFIYAGFWVLYFQMFDSVLWYVQAYVDSSEANALFAPIMNGIYSLLGLDIEWHFDVEFVTVINAFTIIMLQLVISALVKKTKALPTMVVGIMLGTVGMGILAISTNIWVFMAGIVIFSIGEMTAHPKFISYVGQTAPKSRVAMYMGYLFLYGVIGSSIGGVVGANLYVKFVDEMGQPRTLWLIFAGIGVATVIGLLLYNKFLVKKDPVDPAEPAELGEAGGDEDKE